MPVKVIRTEIPDVVVIESPVFRDDRGYFTELFSTKNWLETGLPDSFVQDNLSKSAKGTMRGLHYQIDPHAQGKLVSALSGSIFDVAVDLRIGSSTFGKWVGRTLSGGSGLSMFIPAGFAHGFVALEDDSMLFYKCTSPWAQGSERSLAYNDPAIGIEWPVTPKIISPKDAQAPLLKDADYNFVCA